MLIVFLTQMTIRTIKLKADCFLKGKEKSKTITPLGFHISKH